jgi:hypothetical protein
MEKKMNLKKKKKKTFCHSLGAWNGGYFKQIYKHGTKINVSD